MQGGLCCDSPLSSADLRQCPGLVGCCVQPTLTAYSFNSPAEAALLDVASIAPDRILLLDSFFSVVIFHGTTIAQWRNAGYQHQPEHQVQAAPYAS